MFGEANISTHATHKGGDDYPSKKYPEMMLFQLTPPIRAATDMVTVTLPMGAISTHATHKGGDAVSNDNQQPIVTISTHATHKGGDN